MKFLGRASGSASEEPGQQNTIPEQGRPWSQQGCPHLKQGSKQQLFRIILAFLFHTFHKINLDRYQLCSWRARKYFLRCWHIFLDRNNCLWSNAFPKSAQRTAWLVIAFIFSLWSNLLCFPQESSPLITIGLFFGQGWGISLSSFKANPRAQHQDHAVSEKRSSLHFMLTCASSTNSSLSVNLAVDGLRQEEQGLTLRWGIQLSKACARTLI